MAIIKRIDNKVIEVNGKTVQQDMSGAWVAKFEELTPAEEKALAEYFRFETLKPSFEHKYVNIIEQLEDWHNNNRSQLELIANSDAAQNILIENDEGEQIPMPKEMVKPFKLAVKLALEIIGEFPVKITLDEDE